MKHIPVMKKESINGLNILPNGNYIDATFGFGGHSSEILSKLGDNGNLYALDKDIDAINDLDKSILKVFNVKNSMNAKKSHGGTSIINVKSMIKKYKREI